LQHVVVVVVVVVVAIATNRASTRMTEESHLLLYLESIKRSLVCGERS